MLNLKRNLDLLPLEGGNGTTHLPATQANELHLEAINTLIDSASPKDLLNSLHFMFVECAVKNEFVTPTSTAKIADDYMALWSFLSTLNDKGGNSHG